MNNLEYRRGSTTEDLHKNIDTLNAAKTVIEQLDPWFKGFVQDTDIDLELRWRVFVDNNLGNHDGWYFEPKGVDWDRRTLYDDFHIDKHETYTMVDLLDLAIDEDIIVKGSEEEKLFKESVLEAYLKSAKHDW